MVVHEMNRGGIENFIMNLYRVIDKEKIQFDFVEHTVKRCAFDDEIESYGGVIYHCPDYRIINHFEYSAWWKKFFSEHSEYKIVHSHLDSCANIHLRIAKKYGRVTIAHSHNTEEGFGIKAVLKSMLKIGFNNCCDYKFGCSIAANKWLYGDQFNSAVVIKNGINVSKFDFEISKKYSFLDEFSIKGKTVIGCVARFCNQKNHIFMIDIFAQYQKINPDSVLLLVGDGELKEKVIEKSKINGVLDKVIFAGIRSDVPELLNVFDVFLMPSFYEGLPVSIIEAQASGLRCLLSDTITKEVDVTGLVYYESLNNSPSVWAKRIDSLLPYERKIMAEQIKDAGYDICETAEWLEEFYSSKIKEHSLC